MDNKMQELVQAKIKEIEAVENVEVIMAIESGSRAWGFDSPDSDYDVRFIYTRKPADYLKLEGIRDVIEWQLDETLDINGWDLRKALQLLYRSNATIFEWFASPIVYYKTEKADKMREILPQYFSDKKTLYSYWHMASGNNKEFVQNGEHMIRIKKYFYVLRAILAGKWVVENHTNPPMLFTDLVEAKLDDSLKPIINELLDKKMNVPELKMIRKNPQIDEYINTNLDQLEAYAQSMPNKRDNQWEPLNKLFLDLIM
ncbi:nucleotidyltransferase domain-containing protein [Lactobacillus sp. YT155]|uniref:nucleotidyltransferase domain-containing protein n=1 Tax=Lactobacillus sp. YT155 TaxID=3060955 RepID=UPI00265E8418|nr:nucleotidyltransferase domain-containing protein [Lactobacillus sp. YT155]MDO1604486.1 nucleotidyltransferase domain-containing protein [Lactobacillus sp. YT155]